MNEILAQLIDMRKSSDPSTLDSYKDEFMSASEFIIYGHEFIPSTLLDEVEGGQEALTKIIQEHGKPIVTTQYDKALSKFYKKHTLKRDINHIVDSISYLLIPEEKAPPELVIDDAINSGDFYHVDNIKKLSGYHSLPYHADQADLRQIGRAINDFILQPTNHWLEQLEMSGFDKIPERYWQVAGTFKKRIWGKLQRTEHLDKKVFFCLGIDLENNMLFYGLECLRTGTSKLSTEQIFKFDHFSKGMPLMQSISLDQVSDYSWDKLIRESTDFLSNLILVYDHIIDYIWNDGTDIKSIHNRLIPLSSKKPNPSDELIDTSNKVNSLAAELVVSYEKGYLKYKGKNKLAKKISKASKSENNYDVISRHLDGSEKLIKIIASKSPSIQGATISQSCIDSSIVHQEKSYVYMLTRISSKRKSGILNINRGRFDKIFKTKPESHSVIS